jgi:SAM-dependent methyltransferase
MGLNLSRSMSDELRVEPSRTRPIRSSRFSELLLSHHEIYRVFRRLTGSSRVNREFIEKYVRPRCGETILDLGCGPGDVCELLPNVTYVGIDSSEPYINAARKRFGYRARFICGDVGCLELEELGRLDVAIGMGVIHHLNDESVITVLQKVRSFLCPGGRFVSYDPCFTSPQHLVARWIHSHDRGRFVRFDEEYEHLISRVFSSYKRHIRTDMCTVPATVIIFECAV